MRRSRINYLCWISEGRGCDSSQGLYLRLSMKNKDSTDVMQKRVFFVDKTIRNSFFNKLRKVHGGWSKIIINFKIYRSKLERFRNGGVSIPYFIFSNFLQSLNIKDQEFFTHKIYFRDKNWARSKGGKTTYAKHSYIFEKGRMLAKNRSKYAFPSDTPLDEGLSELIGAFIGDGFTNKYGGAYQIQFTGHAVLDKEYYLKTIIPIIKKISSNFDPRLVLKDNTLRLNIYSKELFLILTKRFGFQPGKKAYTVIIPQEIAASANQKIINSCIRGIFDTDGCVFFDKRKSYYTPYIRIALHMSSKELLKQICDILKKQNIIVTVTKDYLSLQINGNENCNRFINTIGFHNNRHLSKFHA